MTKKRLKGQVKSIKMDKTVVVAIDEKVKHPVYGKGVKLTKKYKARDDIGLKEGDTVIIEESRPYSKFVTWKVVEKLESSKD